MGIPTALPTPRADRRRILLEGSPPTDIPTALSTRYHDNGRKLQKILLLQQKGKWY